MPRRVVTLPPSVRAEAAVEFASRARARRADLLEVRTDLHSPTQIDVSRLAAKIPLLVAERGELVPSSWAELAAFVDRSLDAPGAEQGRQILSLHSSDPLTPDEALARWAHTSIPPAALIKHVEPLGPLNTAARLFETQRRLVERFGGERVTVLATGVCALPFRAMLAPNNAFDYLALDTTWSAAAGQRLLEDAARADPQASGTARFGILGAQIAHSRSPRIHAQPFDRIDLVASTAIGELLDALRPHYLGLAVTSPFKKTVAAHVKAPFPAVNTLVRRRVGWDAVNTDVDGALELLRRLGPGNVTVLGDGGATAALRVAAANARRSLDVLRRAEASQTLAGLAVWTWPEHVAAPTGLRFEGARVGVIAYGSPGRRVAEQIRQLGGTAVPLGVAWFVAQARAQRRFWGTGQ